MFDQADKQMALYYEPRQIKTFREVEPWPNWNENRRNRIRSVSLVIEVNVKLMEVTYS